MKTVAAITIGIAPVVLAIAARVFFGHGVVLALSLLFLSFLCSFLGEFAMADQVTESPTKVSLIGFGLTPLFLAFNLGALALLMAEFS